MKCDFDQGWGGCCKTEVESGYCDKHKNLKCVSCGEPAAYLCEHTFQFICGEPLCNECKHGDPRKIEHKPKEYVNILMTVSVKTELIDGYWSDEEFPQIIVDAIKKTISSKYKDFKEVDVKLWK